MNNSNKVEVINSASSAYRHFVKEKTGVRKMQDTLLHSRFHKPQVKDVKDIRLKALPKMIES